MLMVEEPLRVMSIFLADTFESASPMIPPAAVLPLMLNSDPLLQVVVSSPPSPMTIPSMKPMCPPQALSAEVTP